MPKTYNRPQLRGEMAKLDGDTEGEGGGAKAFKTTVGNRRGTARVGDAGVQAQVSGALEFSPQNSNSFLTRLIPADWHRAALPRTPALRSIEGDKGTFDYSA